MRKCERSSNVWAVADLRHKASSATDQAKGETPKALREAGNGGQDVSSSICSIDSAFGHIGSKTSRTRDTSAPVPMSAMCPNHCRHPSLPDSFIPSLKPSFSANTSYRSLFLRRTDSANSLDCLLILLKF